MHYPSLSRMDSLLHSPTMLEFDELGSSIATRIAFAGGTPQDCDRGSDPEPKLNEKDTCEDAKKAQSSGRDDDARSVPAAVVQRTKVFALTSTAISCIMKDFRKDGRVVKQWLEELSQQELQSLAANSSNEPREVDVHGTMYKLLPSHLQLEEHPGQLGWIRVGDGWLAAAGAPGQVAFANWRREGATSVVSLLRADEPAFEKARDGCQKCGFRWEHAPLAGKRSCTSLVSEPEDLCSWNRLRDLLPQLFNDGERVVIHCAAGMHRTGSVAFCTLRHFGLSIDESLRAVEEGRPVTHGALLEEQNRLTPSDHGKRGQPLWEIVEAARMSRSQC